MHYTQPKSVVMIPSWIMSLLERDGCSISDILQLDKISEVLSTEELANILLLNEDGPNSAVSLYYNAVFGVNPNSCIFPGNSTYPPDTTPAYIKNFASYWFSTKDYNDALDRYRLLYPLIKSTFEERFFNAELHGDLGNRTHGGVVQIKQILEQNKPYRLIDSDKCIFVVLEPQSFTLNTSNEYSKELQRQLTSDVLTMLHAYGTSRQSYIREMECRYIENMSSEATEL